MNAKEPKQSNVKGLGLAIAIAAVLLALFSFVAVKLAG
jgi:hypothetical protein